MPATRPAISTFPSARERLRAQEGVTLVEVVVSALLVGLIVLSLVGLDAVGRTTADQRRRSQAVQVAQQDQERLRAMSADQLAELNQTRTVTLDGVPFTITSTGRFIGSSSGTESCSTSAGPADYARIVSTVDWSSNRRPAVVEQSIIAPRSGGSLIAQVLDQNGNAVSGASVTAVGTDQNTDSIRRSANTDSSGCAIFGALLAGDYSASVSKPDYVDYDGNAAPASAASVTPGNTSAAQFTVGNAGAIDAVFRTPRPAAGYTDQLAPSMSWNNTLMGAFDFASPTTGPADQISTTRTLFPFNTTTPSGPYTIWAGRCAGAMPTTAADRTTVSVLPGRNASASVTMPSLVIAVTYTSSSTIDVKPSHIELTDSCSQNWQPQLNSQTTLPAPSTGWLQYPGQPFGTYRVCADYDPPGSTGFRTRTITNVANTSFSSSPPTVTVPITSGWPSSSGTC